MICSGSSLWNISANPSKLLLFVPTSRALDLTQAGLFCDRDHKDDAAHQDISSTGPLPCHLVGILDFTSVTAMKTIPSKSRGCYRILADDNKARPPVVLVAVPRTRTSVNTEHSHAHPQSPTSPCPSSVPLEFHRATFNPPPPQPSRVVQAPSPDPNRSKPPQYKRSPLQWRI